MCFYQFPKEKLRNKSEFRNEKLGFWILIRCWHDPFLQSSSYLKAAYSSQCRWMASRFLWHCLRQIFLTWTLTWIHSSCFFSKAPSIARPRSLRLRVAMLNVSQSFGKPFSRLTKVVSCFSHLYFLTKVALSSPCIPDNVTAQSPWHRSSCVRKEDCSGLFVRSPPNWKACPTTKCDCCTTMISALQGQRISSWIIADWRRNSWGRWASFIP